jgi:hypothetical protein
MKSNKEVKDLISQFEEVRNISQNFRDKIENNSVTHYLDSEINYRRLSFIERKIDIIQEALMYLIQKSISENSTSII